MSSMNELSRNPNRPLAWARALLDFCAAPGRIVSLLILLHLGFTVPLAYRLSIWVDEAYTLHTTARGVAYAFKQAIYFELQPPLYFVLLNLWRDLDDSIFFARLFSVLCIALAIKTAASLAQRLWKNMHPGWVAAVLAVHPFMIQSATQIRVYALVVLLTGVLLLLFFDGYLAEAENARARWLYLLAAIFALYTYYYLGFILVANACSLVLLRRWRPLFRYLSHMTVVGLCFAPMTWVVLGQVSTHTRPLTSAPSWWESLSSISWRVKDFILPAETPSLVVLRRWMLRLVCGVTILWMARKGKRSLTTANIFIWTIAVVTSLLFVTAMRITSKEMMLTHHTVPLLLPSVLFAFSLILLIPARKAVLISVLIFSVFNLISFRVQYKTVTKDRDWAQVAAYVTARERPGQAILVFHAGGALPLAHYYKGANSLVPIPREHNFETFDIRDYVLRDEQEIFDALAQVPGEHEELWLITDNVCGYLGVDYNCQALEEFVDKYYSVENSQTFPSSKVRLLRRKSLHNASAHGSKCAEPGKHELKITKAKAARPPSCTCQAPASPGKYYRVGSPWHVRKRGPAPSSIVCLIGANERLRGVM